MSDRLLKESDVLKIAFQLPLVVNSAFADAVKALPSARPKEEQIAIGAVCEVICKHCIKANGCCQHHWKCPLLTEIAELMESKDEPQIEREGE